MSGPNVLPSDGRSVTPDGRAPRLRGRSTVLRPIGVADYEMLRYLEQQEDLVGSWRHGGATPSPDQWAHGLWAGVLAQFIVVDVAKDLPLGLVCAYEADARNRHCSIAATKFDIRDRSTGFIRSVGLFIDYLFTNWDFRKLYFETGNRSLDFFRSAVGDLLTEEGRLCGHRFSNGKYEDLIILSLYRDVWEERVEPFRQFL